MSSVRLEKIQKYFGKQKILNNINLDIGDGEFLVLVGPSGCGKSTSLRLIAGLEDATDGNIYINGNRVNDMDPAKRDIAMVFQNYALYPHLNVCDNMSFGLRIRKVANEEIHNRVNEAADILQIKELLDRKPKELSGGQRQRVALGRAIVRKPKVFLFDEPLSNLDAKLRSEMRIEIKHLHKILKTTMIYVTHDQTEAMTMGDRIAVMNNGQIEQIDTPNDLYYHPENKFVASFIGMPQMNFIRGRIEIDNNNIKFRSGSLLLTIGKDKIPKVLNDNNEYTLGIRPDDIYEKLSSEYHDENNVFKALVDIIEPLGSHMLIHVTCNDHKLTTMFRGTIGIQSSDKIEVIFDVSKIHLFNE